MPASEKNSWTRSEIGGHAAIFLDKDGTLVEDLPYNADVTRIRFYKEVFPVLARLSAKGYKLIIISNQPGIARGYFDESDMKRVELVMQRLLAQQGIPLTGFHYCPHDPDGSVRKYAVECDCRKPRQRLITRAARDHQINLEESWMIGDILNDVEAGNRAGCRTILVDRGNETEWLTGPFRTPDYIVNDLYGALERINVHSRQQPPRDSRAARHHERGIMNRNE